MTFRSRVLNPNRFSNFKLKYIKRCIPCHKERCHIEISCIAMVCLVNKMIEDSSNKNQRDEKEQNCDDEMWSCEVWLGFYLFKVLEISKIIFWKVLSNQMATIYFFLLVLATVFKHNLQIFGGHIFVDSRNFMHEST